MFRKQACKLAGSRQSSEGEAQKDGEWLQGRSVTSLSGFWGVAYPALMTTQKLLGCRHHGMDSSPESVVYTRESRWGDFRKQDETEGAHRPQEVSCGRRNSVRKGGAWKGKR